MRQKFYAGIGSRETPTKTLSEMTGFAAQATVAGWTLRSGGAEGADSAFQQASGSAEIYLPWPNYNGQSSKYCFPSPKAYQLASTLHPAWHRLRQPVRALHARNTQIILGDLLNTPVEFVICWTPKGEEIGGTALGIRLARKNNIPVFNLFIEGELEEALRMLNAPTGAAARSFPYTIP